MSTDQTRSGLSKKVNRAPNAGAGGFHTICTAVCDRSDSSTAWTILKPIMSECIVHIIHSVWTPRKYTYVFSGIVHIHH